MLLKTLERKSKYKLIGASLPLWVDTYMSLYSLAKDKSKTRIIEIALTEFIKQASELETEEQLLLQVVDRIKRAYRLELRKSKPKSIVEFKNVMLFELKKKKIPIQYINLILSRL